MTNLPMTNTSAGPFNFQFWAYTMKNYIHAQSIGILVCILLKLLSDEVESNFISHIQNLGILQQSVGTNTSSSKHCQIHQTVFCKPINTGSCCSVKLMLWARKVCHCRIILYLLVIEKKVEMGKKEMSSVIRRNIP